jgi:hypothetical protein
LDVKKLAGNPRKMKSMIKEYRFIKAQPEQSMSQGTLGLDLTPRVYLFSKFECVIFNREVFRFL